MSRLFEKKQRVQDGVVIASLLEEGAPQVGDEWWLHDDLAYTASPPRQKRWYLGEVVESDEKHFVVKAHAPLLPVGGSIERVTTFPVEATVSPRELTQLAMASLFCIEYEQVTFELLADDNPNPTEATHQLATRCKPGEIDWFVSHSWHDNVVEKWKTLQAEAEVFRKAKGRYPVLWLDKVCIDQKAIQQSLKCLPVYLLACKSMIVLGGPTYITRLWCVWELYTLYALSTDVDPSIIIREFGSASDVPTRLGTPSKSAAAPAPSLQMQLEHFKVGVHSKCYDPNEEAKLLRAIRSAAGGEGGFNRSIQELAKMLGGDGRAHTVA